MKWWRVGFGLEKIGLTAQARPVIFSALTLLLIAVAVASLFNLKFSGSVLAVLPEQAPAYRDYEKIRADYRNFARDVTILVESERLLTSQGMEDLRNFQLDLSLADGISSAVSIFSVPDFDPQSGELREWFPETLGSDAETMALVDQLVEKYPQASSLFNRERAVAIVVATLPSSVHENDGESFAALRELEASARELAPDDFELSFTGLTPIGAAILAAMLDDQFKLTIIGLLLGTAIAYAIFRTFLAAILCAMPPLLTALWSFGMFALAGVPINYLTTVLPTLALVLAFADGIFLYFRWQTLNSAHDDPDANLTEAISRVGPASALTSITTALAFLSFSYADSEALKEFAYLGAGAVTLAFIAVIVGLPVAIHWSIRLGLVRPGRHAEPSFQKIGKRVRPLVIGHPAALSAAGVILVLVLGYVQQDVTAEYKMTQYLPHDSDVRHAELLANEVTGGRALMLVSVPFDEPGGLDSAANRARIAEVGAIAEEFYGADLVFSAARVIETAGTPAARERILDYLTGEEGGGQPASLVSQAADQGLVTVRLNSDVPIARTKAETEAFQRLLEPLPYADRIVVSGFPVLMSTEFTRLIDQLLVSLLLAIVLGIVIVGIATHSPLLFLAATTPNLLPIFFILSVLYLTDGTVNLSEVVALTIAFGIAIDNAVHLINVLDSQRREGKKRLHALSAALEEAGPALTAGTVIICTSIIVTQISSLPVVPELGQLMIITLVVALLSNLVLLPANILTLDGLKRRLLRQPEPSADPPELR